MPARKLQGLTGLQVRAVPFSEGLAATSAPALPPQHSLDHLLTPCQAEQAPLGAHRPSCPRQSGRRPLCCLGRWAGQPPPAHRAPPALPYLGSNILKRGWAHQGEADQEDVLERRGPRRRRSRRLQKAPVPLTSGLRGPPRHPALGVGPAGTYSLRVGEWPQPVVVLLPSSVPQPQVDWLPIHHHVGGVVIETAGAEQGGRPGSDPQACAAWSSGSASAPLQKPRGVPCTGAQAHPWEDHLSSPLTRWGCTLPGRHWSCN